jgi:oligopeptidase A
VGDIRLALAEAREGLESLEQTPLDRLSWDNTLEELIHFDQNLSDAWAKLDHLNNVCDSEALRAAYLEVLPEVTQFFASIPLRPKLWQLVRSYAATEEARQLSPLRARHLRRTLEGFIDSGADLPPEKKGRILEIEQRLSQLTNQFGKNVLDAKNAWAHEAKLEELRGLPESVLGTLPAGAAPGTRRLSLQAPCLGPCLQYLEDRELRRKLWEASLAVGREGPYDNRPLIREILALREEHARILGEKTHADCVLRRRMAKKGQQALAFIDDLHRRVGTFALRECQALQDFRDGERGSREALEPWDVGFWSEKLRQKLHHFDEEALRPYFPIDAVFRGLFSIAQKLYGICVRERPTHAGAEAAGPDSVPVWQGEVRFFEVYEASGKYIGAFYADCFPRASKRGGAWMGDRVGRRGRDGHYRYPVGVLCANLSPAAPGRPALLTHSEVTTLFHEFGHLLHSLFGQLDIAELNGSHVVWDFVELPSQLMENFCWDRKSLDLFARHHETGKKIPQKLFRAMKSARNHLSGLAMLSQLCLSRLDLELHQHYASYREELWEETLRERLAPYRPPWSVDSPSIVAQFSHIFNGGYDAGYYSYLWAAVLEADAFGAFEAQGVLDAQTGERFRRCILSQGDLYDADQLFRNFMGRDPDPTALLRREGLWESSPEPESPPEPK